MTKFKARLSKKGIAELPSNKSGIYIIRNNSGTNIFTGVVTRGKVEEQLKEHLYGGSDYIPGVWVCLEQCNLTEANAKLKAILEKEKPRYN